MCTFILVIIQCRVRSPTAIYVISFKYSCFTFISVDPSDRLLQLGTINLAKKKDSFESRAFRLQDVKVKNTVLKQGKYRLLAERPEANFQNIQHAHCVRSVYEFTLFWYLPRL